MPPGISEDGAPGARPRAGSLNRWWYRPSSGQVTPTTVLAEHGGREPEALGRREFCSPRHRVSYLDCRQEVTRPNRTPTWMGGSSAFTWGLANGPTEPENRRLPRVGKPAGVVREDSGSDILKAWVQVGEVFKLAATDVLKAVCPGPSHRLELLQADSPMNQLLSRTKGKPSGPIGRPTHRPSDRGGRHCQLGSPRTPWYRAALVPAPPTTSGTMSGKLG